jgi:phosphatidylethanolamine/phosphatidyl-N-methylethanolamine N-methyltransferase
MGFGKDFADAHPITFLRQFLSEPKYVGAVMASSRILAEAITEAAKVHEASVVIELGPGTGSITEVIARRVRRGATFCAIEINPKFVQATRRRCPSVHVIEGSAADAKKHLTDMGLETCDCIVSGLPWAAFDEELQTDLLTNLIDVLRPGGRFVTYTYILSPFLAKGRRFRKKLYSTFRLAKRTPIVWRNVPPAFMYYAEK